MKLTFGCRKFSLQVPEKLNFDILVFKLKKFDFCLPRLLFSRFHNDNNYASCHDFNILLEVGADSMPFKAISYYHTHLIHFLSQIQLTKLTQALFHAIPHQAWGSTHCSLKSAVQEVK